MVARFSTNDEWIVTCVDAIVARNGVLLKKCIVAAMDGEVAILQDDSNESLNGLIDSLYETFSTKLQKSSSVPASAPANVVQAVEEEHLHLVETMVRVTLTGALAKYQQQNRIILRVPSTSIESCQPSNNELVRKTVHNTLLKGMLYAFEAFQEVHCMTRTHYPPRKGVSTKGSVGWDTLVLLYFVHHIPHIARDASGAVVDDATAELVRKWRKLLKAVQTADSHEAAANSRRRGALSIVNGLLMILFNRYNTHQCKALIDTIEHNEKFCSENPMKSVFQSSQHMISEVLTYYYYKGRLALYTHHFDEALNSLRHAYTLLPPLSIGSEPQIKNKFRVRFFLAIASIVTGKMIPAEIMKEDKILEPMLSPIIESIQRGDPVALYHAVENNSTTFRRRGVYLILKQSKQLCSLMLIARVHRILADSALDPSRIPLSALVEAQKIIINEGKPLTEIASPTRKKEYEESFTLRHTTSDTIGLAVTSLIAREWVRGYLSYEHQTLVLSKANPFPTMQTNTTP